ncbi:MAG: phage holin family protein [Actinomycetota bacterium]|nr:phage holin family protein [Actinomycetota bacterium]
MPDSPQQSISDAVTEISERASLLVREEIELAKAEITEKLSRLVKGLVVGAAAGIFVVTALLFVLHGFAWLGAVELFDGNQIYWGFFLVAGLLFVFGGIAGWLAAKALRSSSSPKPEMAIDEAKRIRDTVTSQAQPGPRIGRGR